MNGKVKLSSNNGVSVLEVDFAHAEKILQTDKLNTFEIVDKLRFEFIDNELIKRAVNRNSKKSRKSKQDNEGKKVPK
jgi:hypothetical protein